MNLLSYVIPETILIVAAGVLCLMGVVDRPAARRAVPFVAIAAMAAALLAVLYGWGADSTSVAPASAVGSFRLTPFSQFVKALTLAVGGLFVLLSWPSDGKGYGNASLDYGRDAGEYFGLMLLAVAGVLLVAGANDLLLLFMGIELASIPTYVMVSMSRPLPAAQEAGVKYFFLGAMSAAIMLFGFSYLFGTTGTTNLDEIGRAFAAQTPTYVEPAGPATVVLTPPARPDVAFVPVEVVPHASAATAMQVLAVVMLVVGFGFKIAAVPVHLYAGDVYQGAATPVTAMLSFIPKITGMVALVKVLLAVGGNQFAVPTVVVDLLWWVAALTMTVGNVLGLLQVNVKRVLAYSSIAHTGYMLVGVTALCAATGAADPSRVDLIQNAALQGVLFYLAAYGVMNAGAFGVLMLLPSRQRLDDAGREAMPGEAGDAPPATTAETYEDLAGQGRRHPMLGLAMAVSMFSLIGLPLTVGFFGKIYLIKPALDVGTPAMVWLVGILLVNAAISAAYYLRIIATMFLRPLPDDGSITADGAEGLLPATAASSTVSSSRTGETEVPAGGSRLGRAALSPSSPRVWPITAAVVLSVAGTLLLGIVLPVTEALSVKTSDAARLVDTVRATDPALAPAVASAR